jgi:Ca2+-binding RTX toxin-like protein
VTPRYHPEGFAIPPVRRIILVTLGAALTLVVPPGPARAAAGVNCAGLPATVLGTPGPDVLLGTLGNDVVVAGSGDDVVFGLDGSDIACLGPGDDVFKGGEGDDIFMAEAPGGRDTFFGEGGRDTADYSARTTGVEVSVDGVANDGSPGEEDNIHPDAYTVIGGSAGDLLVGGNETHRFNGGGDDRVLEGPAADGSDTVDGGPGRDEMSYLTQSGCRRVA